MVKDLEFRSGTGGTKAITAARVGKEEGEGTAAAAAMEVDRNRASSRGLSFELPFVSKYLLLAAYVASRNKPATDRQVFDPTYRRQQRVNAQRMDRQARTACCRCCRVFWGKPSTCCRVLRPADPCTGPMHWPHAG